MEKQKEKTREETSPKLPRCVPHSHRTVVVALCSQRAFGRERREAERRNMNWLF